MKKILFAVLLVLMLGFSVISAGAEQIYYNNEFHYYDAGEIGLKVNGKAVINLPMYPVIIDNYTMVPVREVFEALGSQVIWHDDTCQVEVIDNGVSVLIGIGDRNTYIDGKLVTIDEGQPMPMLIGPNESVLKSMVPVRFVAEHLGFKVDWDNESRTVLINDEGKEVIGNIEYSEEEYKIPAEAGKFGRIYAKTDSEYDYIYVPSKIGISPQVTRYSDPERIVFDFPGALFDNLGGSEVVNGNCVDRVRYSNHNSQARVVLDISDKAQVMILSDANGILLRAKRSENNQIMYDTYEGRVYFDKNYSGSGESIKNGYKVTFTNLKMKAQTIKIADGKIYEINISETSNGCIVTVDGSNQLVYTAEKGFYRSDTPVENETPSFDKADAPLVVLDPGHGGSDPGALGYDNNGSIAARESKINLAIALLVGKKLEASGVKVIYTRDNDTYVKLQERSEISNNADCDLFVSIHCNAIENKDVKGTQVYYHPISKIGTVLAENIYDKLVALTGLTPKGTQNGSHLYVIRTTVSPAVLVESAFISNAADREYLLSAEGQETIAEAIYQGIMKTLS